MQCGQPLSCKVSPAEREQAIIVTALVSDALDK